MIKKIQFIKKVFILLVIIFSFWINTYAYETNVIKDPKLQNELKWKKIDYDWIRKELWWKYKDYTDEQLQKNLEDWLEWPITRAAKVVKEKTIKETQQTHSNNYWKCSFDNNSDVMWALENCIWDWKTDLVKTWSDLNVETWFKKKLTEWTTKIATFLALWAIFSIALGALKMVLSWWEEEKIKKAKDIVKWWILGLLWVVSAGFLISVVVKLVYSIWSV